MRIGFSLVPAAETKNARVICFLLFLSPKHCYLSCPKQKSGRACQNTPVLSIINMSSFEQPLTIAESLSSISLWFVLRHQLTFQQLSTALHCTFIHFFNQPPEPLKLDFPRCSKLFSPFPSTEHLQDKCYWNVLGYTTGRGLCSLLHTQMGAASCQCTLYFLKHFTHTWPAELFAPQYAANISPPTVSISSKALALTPGCFWAYLTNSTFLFDASQFLFLRERDVMLPHERFIPLVPVPSTCTAHSTEEVESACTCTLPHAYRVPITCHALVRVPSTYMCTVQC